MSEENGGVVISMNKVMVSGHLCIDIIPEINNMQSYNNFIKPGSLNHVGPIQMKTGGVVSNTGIALKKMGMDVLLNGKIGDDHLGQIIRNILKEYYTGAGIRIAKGEASSYTIVLAPPGVDRILFHNPGANDTFSIDDVDFEGMEDISLFHFGYPPLMKKMYKEDGDNLINIFKEVGKRGVITSLDMALPDPASESGKINWTSFLKNILPYVDIFAPSIEEITFMVMPKIYHDYMMSNHGLDFIKQVNGSFIQELSSALLEWGAGIVLLKCGIKGIYIRTGNEERLSRASMDKLVDLKKWSDREIWIPAFLCKNILSTAGAGDCAIAGFLTAFLRGLEIEKAASCSAVLGYQNLFAADAYSGIKDWEETMKIIQENNLTQYTLDNMPKGWIFEEEIKIWIGPNDTKQCE